MSGRRRQRRSRSRGVQRSRALYVSGKGFKLPPHINGFHLKQHFSDFDDYVEKAIIMRDEDQQSKGFGMVCFSSAEAASDAIEMLGDSKLQGKYSLLISQWKGKSGDYGSSSASLASAYDLESESEEEEEEDLSIDGSSTLYVTGKSGKFPNHITSKHLNEHFSEVDHVIKKAMIIRNMATKKSYGYGLITFTSELAASAVLRRYSGTMLRGKHELYISYKSDSKRESISSVSSSLRSSLASFTFSSDEDSVSDIEENESCDDRTLYISVKNSKLPDNIKAKHLRKHFSKMQQEIEKVIVLRNRKTRTSKGYGFITFTSHSAATRAEREFKYSKLHGMHELYVSLKKSNSKKVEVPLECSEETMIYLVHNFFTLEFDTLKKSLPAELTKRGNKIYLSGSNAQIKSASQRILSSNLVAGLTLKVFNLSGEADKVKQKFELQKYYHTRCIVYDEDASSFSLLLYGRNSVEYCSALKLLQMLKPQSKTYQVRPEAVSLPGLLPFLASKQSELPVTFDKRPGQTVIIHGLCMEDIEAAWSKVKEFINANITIEKKADMKVFELTYFLKKFEEEAKNQCCSLSVPSQLKLLPPGRTVSISVRGKEKGVKIVIDKIKTLILSTDEVSTVLAIKDDVVCMMLANDEKRFISLKLLAKYHGVVLQVVCEPHNIGLKIIGTLMKLNPAKEAILSYIKSIELDSTQLIFSASYKQICASKEVSMYSDNLKESESIVMKFSTDERILRQVHLRTESGHVTTIQIVKGVLSKEKVDGIVLPTGTSTVQHQYPIELTGLKGQSFQDGCSQYVYNDSSQIGVGLAVAIDGGELPCKKIIHTLFPLSVQRMSHTSQYNTTMRNILLRASVLNLDSIAFPAINAQMIQAIADNLPSQMHVSEIRIVLESSAEIKAYVQAMDALFPESSLPTQAAIFSWSWYNDEKSYTAYSKILTDKLNDAFRTDPRGKCSFVIKGELYEVDFQTMKQVNKRTGFSRSVSKTISSSAKNAVMWYYMADTAQFTAYDPANSAIIESFYAQNDCSKCLIINSKRYRFDFKAMKQINDSTGYKRTIKREAKGGAVSKYLSNNEVVINIRGPKATVTQVTAKIEEKLLSLLYVKRIPLPTSLALSSALLHKFRTTAKRYAVGFDESIQSVIKLEGLELSVQAAVTEIQADIINFQSISGSTASKVVKEDSDYPSEWEPQSDDCKIVKVSRHCMEFSSVEAKFKETLPYYSIIEIKRVQNKWLWDRYAHAKRMLHKKNAGKINEKELFHGSGATRSDEICASDEGFDSRYSREGLWGQANYFAVNASYSDAYAHPLNDLQYDSREVILAKVLTGDSCECSQDRKLRMPPLKTSHDKETNLKQVRYDTVSGTTQGSQVFMTYSNDKAYPAYIIVYTRKRSTSRELSTLQSSAPPFSVLYSAFKSMLNKS